MKTWEKQHQNLIKYIEQFKSEQDKPWYEHCVSCGNLRCMYTVGYWNYRADFCECSWKIEQGYEDPGNFWKERPIGIDEDGLMDDEFEEKGISFATFMRQIKVRED